MILAPSFNSPFLEDLKKWLADPKDKMKKVKKTKIPQTLKSRNQSKQI